jgi:putative heme-binding domain-containing protein
MFRLLFSSIVLINAILAQEAVTSGKALFRSNCAFCHGLTGTGGRGPSLVSATIVQNTTDAVLTGIIQKGIAGTTMPAFDSFQADDLAYLVAFIRSLATSGVKSEPVSGDAEHGARVYAQNGCASCHRIGGSGGNYGPDLTRIAAARSPEYIRQSIVDPSADIPEDFRGVSIVTADGKHFTGVRVNEDTFSVQLRLQNDKFALYRKSSLKSVEDEKKSLMPAYSKLAAKDLQDLGAYLDTLRGRVAAATDAEKAKGIH